MTKQFEIRDGMSSVSPPGSDPKTWEKCDKCKTQVACLTRKNGKWLCGNCEREV